MAQVYQIIVHNDFCFLSKNLHVFQLACVHTLLEFEMNEIWCRSATQLNKFTGFSVFMRE